MYFLAGDSFLKSRLVARFLSAVWIVRLLRVIQTSESLDIYRHYVAKIFGPCLTQGKSNLSAGNTTKGEGRALQLYVSG